MATADMPRTSHRSSPPPQVTPARPVSAVRATEIVRIGDDSFVAEASVDAWIRGGAARRAGAVIVCADGTRYVLRDALRVLGRRNGDTDPYGFTGSVETMRELVRRGATISADALRLGPAVYDIEYGYLVAPCDGA